MGRGFRPFFLGGAAWAALAMGGWLGLLSGALVLPIAFDPVSWHAHELLFGTLAAIIAGFLLTAVPNWTGRPALMGWRLAVLFCLWPAGRIAVLLGAHLPPILVAGVDLALPVALIGLITLQIAAARNWRNLVVVALLVGHSVGNALYHWEAAMGGAPAAGLGLRLGLGAAIGLIAVIGGRVVPAFTRNWLSQKAEARLPAAPSRLDVAAPAVLFPALAGWVAAPAAAPTGWMLILAGLLQAVRLARWRGLATRGEPLLWVLHVAYGFVPLGALGLGVAILAPGTPAVTEARHLWMAGAVGLMTLAMMTRASLGHSGRALRAGGGTLAIYLSLLLAVAARLAAGALPGEAAALHTVSGLLWIAAFGGFVALYGPMLVRGR